jgi:hypothetical protein
MDTIGGKSSSINQWKQVETSNTQKPIPTSTTSKTTTEKTGLGSHRISVISNKPNMPNRLPSYLPGLCQKTEKKVSQFFLGRARTNEYNKPNTFTNIFNEAISGSQNEAVAMALTFNLKNFFNGTVGKDPVTRMTDSLTAMKNFIDKPETNKKYKEAKENILKSAETALKKWVETRPPGNMPNKDTWTF